MFPATVKAAMLLSLGGASDGGLLGAMFQFNKTLVDRLREIASIVVSVSWVYGRKKLCF